MIELVVASTVFAALILSTFASTGSFSATLADQKILQDQLTAAGVVRARILGDADSSTSVGCMLPDGLALGVTSPPGAFIGYTASEGRLRRYDSAADHWSTVSDSAPSLTCNDLGTEGVYVGIELGTLELPYHMHVRISAGGGGA